MDSEAPPASGHSTLAHGIPSGNLSNDGAQKILIPLATLDIWTMLDAGEVTRTCPQALPTTCRSLLRMMRTPCRVVGITLKLSMGYSEDRPAWEKTLEQGLEE